MDMVFAKYNKCTDKGMSTSYTGGMLFLLSPPLLESI